MIFLDRLLFFILFILFFQLLAFTPLIFYPLYSFLVFNTLLSRLFSQRDE